MEDVIIGLEIHVQLNRLASKMFCNCSTAYHTTFNAYARTLTANNSATNNPI